MTEKNLQELLQNYKVGKVSENDALAQLKNLSIDTVE